MERFFAMNFGWTNDDKSVIANLQMSPFQAFLKRR
jgi:hypothetical protein